MAEFKCSRCDRRYSSFRSRCPFCGTRRRKIGKRVSDSDNATWKLVIGILLLVILVAAVIILLVTSLSGRDNETEPSVTPSFSHGDGVTETSPTPTPTSTPTPTPTPTPVLTTESVIITYNGNLREDVTMKVGDVLQFGTKTVPEETNDTPIWSSENEDFFVVLQTGKVTAVGRGTAKLKVTCGSATAECLIRVK